MGRAIVVACAAVLLWTGAGCASEEEPTAVEADAPTETTEAEEVETTTTRPPRTTTTTTSTTTTTTTTAPPTTTTTTTAPPPPTTTAPPATEPVEAPADGGCDPSYSGACVPIASDVDCAGGSGDGPAYVQGPVTVVGSDPYGLDNDDDGVGCES